MIGKTIESFRPPPLAAAIWLALAVVCGGLAGALQDANWVLAAALPVTMGSFLLLGRGPAHWTGTLYEDRLEIIADGARRTIPYSTMQLVYGDGRPYDPQRVRPGQFAIYVVLNDEVTIIPRNIDGPSNEVFRFLSSRLTHSGSRLVDERLQPYLQRQVEMFGDDRVASFVWRKRLPNVLRRSAYIVSAILLTGAVWLIGAFVLYGFAKHPRESNPPFEQWAGMGGMLLIFGFLWLLFIAARRSRRALPHRQFKNASLVISPVGIALIQGHLTGEMTWDELQDVQLVDRHRRSYRLTMNEGWYGVRVRVEGAEIVIADIYDRPPTIIYQRIQQFWKPATMTSPPAPVQRSNAT